MIWLIRDANIGCHHNDARCHVPFLSCRYDTLNRNQLAYLLGRFSSCMFCLFMSVPPHLLFFFLLHPWRNASFQTSISISQILLQLAVFHFSPFPLCLGVSGNIRKSFIDSMCTILATPKSVLLIDFSWERLPLYPSSCHHHLLVSSFAVLLASFPTLLAAF